jgi:hypothetical protein
MVLYYFCGRKLGLIGQMFCCLPPRHDVISWLTGPRPARHAVSETRAGQCLAVCREDDFVELRYNFTKEAI